MRNKTIVGLFLAAIPSLLSCKHTNSNRLSAESTSVITLADLQKQEAPEQCAAIRGNGTLIWGHFGSMAKLLETEGLFDGIAGGSSGSITSFLYESMLTNPALYEGCTPEGCSRSEVARRVALLFKTLPLWLETVEGSKEGLALANVMAVGKELKQFDLRKLDASTVESLRTGLESLATLLRSSAVRALVNPEFLKFVSPLDTDSLATLKFRAAEARVAIQSFGAFKATDPAILFRPGIINFRGAAQLIGNMADFYAGYAPQLRPGWSELYKQCLPATLGKTPWEISEGECGTRFRALQQQFFAQQNTVTQHRIDEAVGSKILAFASTASLVSSQDIFKEARARYRAAQGASLDLPLDAVQFGYASSPAVGARLQAGLGLLEDARSQRYLPLGAMRWGDVLAISPAEPGLAEAQEFVDQGGRQLISFGGWSDLSPVLALQAAQCKRTIFVTRQGMDSNFARGVTRLVGLGPIEDQLYSLESASSSFAQAVNRADAIYCTNWDAYDGMSEAGIKQLFLHTYREVQLVSGDRAGAPKGCQKVP